MPKFLSALLIITLAFSANLQAGSTVQQLSQKAEKGDALAQYNLGFRYEIGLEVAKNMRLAEQLYKQAAEQGLAQAQYSLGHLYSESNKFKEARFWYEKANQQGLADAQFALGILYYNGQGVEQNYHRAKEFFGQSCDAGEAEGCEEYRKLNSVGI